MNKILLSFLFFALSFCVNAQSYIGFLTDNYSGVHGVISNPASIIGSPLKVDINLIGASAFGSNDYFGINVLDATKDGYSFDLESKKHPKDDNRGTLVADVLGPSIMFRLSDKSALALFTRVRAFTNLNEIDGASIASIDDDTTADYNINEGDFNISAHAWSEIGISYSRIILDKDKQTLKIGASLKYLQGRASAYAIGTDVTFLYDDDGTDLGGGETTGNISTSGNLTYARFAEFDEDDYNYKTPNKANGIGVDFGVVYELKSRNNGNIEADSMKVSNVYKTNQNYKLKLGLSITDIGYIDYKEGVKEAFNIVNTDISEDDFDDAINIGSFLDSFYNKTNSEIGYIMDLPTALHFNVDYNFNDKIYLNFNTDYSLISKDRRTASRVSNVVSLTPRYESKWFSFYMPLSAVENNGFRIGAGLRAGPLYVGSGSVISAFTSDDNRGADVYAGLKLPLFRKASKDKDNDGIVDKLDDCPKLPGPAENNGCPWGDKDNDGVLDNVDACPEEAGDKDKNGCPWGDRDGDSILDNVDACPDLYGLEVNNGCPYKDSDGDGVFDKDDICVDEKGTKANKGCPEEVIEKLQKTLSDYAHVILFDSGTASIEKDSKQTLAKIIAILKEYPNATFTIEGHTDSIGTYEHNQKLSEARANSIKSFLVKNGIESTRLSAVGYGERKPIATNMYKAGRAKNRRVEINLVK